MTVAEGMAIQNAPSDANSTESARNVFVRFGIVDVFICFVVSCCLTSRTQAQPPSRTQKGKMTMKNHKPSATGRGSGCCLQRFVRHHHHSTRLLALWHKPKCPKTYS